MLRVMDKAVVTYLSVNLSQVHTVKITVILNEP